MIDLLNALKNKIATSAFFVENNLIIEIIQDPDASQLSNILPTLFICDRDFISKEYETLSYDSLEDDESIGFFILNDYNDVLVSLIANVKEDVVKLTLLCKNKNIKEVKGAPKVLLTEVNIFFTTTLKKTTTLNVAKGTQNTHAIKFYQSIGFNIDGCEQNRVTMKCLNGGSNKHPKKQWKLMTLKELAKIARAMDIKGRSCMNKDEMISALKKKYTKRS